MNAAIVLSGGKGSRMHSDIPKQYMELCGRPLLMHSLNVFEKSPLIDSVILVCAAGEQDFVREHIVEAGGYNKIAAVVAGGQERYDSVYCGLSELMHRFPSMLQTKENHSDFIWIHDGARPCVEESVLERCLDVVSECGACVAAMPVKDTIKIVDEHHYAVSTPNRKELWQIQTPQVFAASLIWQAYSKLYMDMNKTGITDDAMVVERYTNTKVKMAEGSYCNIKVTTREDLDIAEIFLKKILTAPK